MIELEYMAMHWLRYEKRCSVVITGRSPRCDHGLPDVLGITQNRYLLEIEIKRSLSDFRANGRKPFIAERDAMFKLEGEVSNEKWPRNFWYLVPHELADKIKPLLPPWAGLLRGPTEGEVQSVWSVVTAPQNKASKPLDQQEFERLAHCMSNQIWSLTDSVRKLKQGIVWKSENDTTGEWVI